jgi:glucose-1-phosphate thymidylyltransferase
LLLKGVILAGGTGTRLFPLTRLMNKHLLPVGRQPMILYGIQKLKEVGITDILIITGKQSAGLYTDFLGSGVAWGVRLFFNIQEEAGGIAHALSQAEAFMLDTGKFIVLLGDNLFEHSLQEHIEQFKLQERGARVILKQVKDPRRYGVPIFRDNVIESIDEKPADPKSSYCVTGIYMYDSSVFDIIRGLKPSERGELEITDVNNVFARQGLLAYSLMEGWWTDAGTFESLQEAGLRMGEGSDE